MDELRGMFSNPTFWVGTVLMGIIVNLVASGVWKLGGGMWPRWLAKREGEREVRRQRIAAGAQSIRGQVFAAIVHQLRGIDAKLDAIYMLLWGVLVCVIGLWFLPGWLAPLAISPLGFILAVVRARKTFGDDAAETALLAIHPPVEDDVENEPDKNDQENLG